MSLLILVYGLFVSALLVKSHETFSRPLFPISLSSEMTAKVELIKNVKKCNKKGSVIVIKYGGSAMNNDILKDQFLEDIVALVQAGIHPVIVHGGGPQIEKVLQNFLIESKFIDGLRVTDKETLEVAQMVLCGNINKDLTGRICQKRGIPGALGLSGLDCKLILATIKEPQLGLVGEPIHINSDLLNKLIGLEYIPIIAPIATNIDGSGSLNVNADTAAGAIAEALQADKFLLLTDVAGVLDKSKNLIDQISIDKYQTLKGDGTISGGMIPKLETAISAVEAGVSTVHIIDGRELHSVLKALSGEKFGTTITK